MRIFFAEGDGSGWALDEDLRLLKSGLGEFGSESPLERSEAVVAVWWWKLLRLRRRRLEGKLVIALADNPPLIYARHPSFLAGSALVDLWVARSQEAMGQFELLGLPAVFAPYAVDTAVFRPLPADDGDVARARRRLGAPEGAFLVGSFHRDTDAAGRPKEQKAPEVFLEIVLAARERGVPVFPVLAGPRRHWLREALRARGVRFAFAGDETVRGDDYPANVLPRSELNVLYNLLDLYVISSRWEGGPHSVLEAASAGCPVISTPVGVSRDLLPAGQLFNTVREGAECVAREFRSRGLRAAAEQLRETCLERHSAGRLAERFDAILREAPGRAKNSPRGKFRNHDFEPGLPGRLMGRVVRTVRGPLRVRVREKCRPGSAGAVFLGSLRRWPRPGRLRFVSGDERAHIELEARDERAVLRALSRRGDEVTVFFATDHFLEAMGGGLRPWEATLLPTEFEGDDRCGQIAGDEPIAECGKGGPVVSREPGEAVADRFAELAEMVWAG